MPVALASGFLATLAMTTIMYILPLTGLGRVDLPLWVARLFFSDPAPAVVAGVTIHLFLGFGYALLFADQIEPRVTARLAGGPVEAGLAFGVCLWVIAQTIAVPALGLVSSVVHGGTIPSPGLFAARLGLGAASASLVAHLAYGCTLGFVYGRCRYPYGWSREADRKV